MSCRSKKLTLPEAIFKTTFRLEEADGQAAWDEMWDAEDALQYLIDHLPEQYRKRLKMAAKRQSNAAMRCGFTAQRIYKREYREE